RPDRGIELSGGVIIEKKKRLCTLHDKIVDAHGDEIDPDRAMNTAQRGDFDLGAHAVSRGNKYWIGKARSLEIERSGEAANFSIRTAPPRGMHDRANSCDHGIASVDVHAGISIGEAAVSLHFDRPGLFAPKLIPGARPERTAGQVN